MLFELRVIPSDRIVFTNNQFNLIQKRHKDRLETGLIKQCFINGFAQCIIGLLQKIKLPLIKVDYQNRWTIFRTAWCADSHSRNCKSDIGFFLPRKCEEVSPVE
ncbi:MAG: hypothetical protein CVU51_07370 [Deltaproteobacteria bacterium HGW-Deltaproteobacteria-1]|nr:MAG: hypothetical protein CVU51_07370 [Deltaproteobacteria bacterium HGW-Deltaproteobacteria-1]